MMYIEEALKYVDETKALIIEDGAINKVAALFNKQFPNKKGIIVSDQYMYDKFGKRIANILDEFQIIQDNPFIFKVF